MASTPCSEPLAAPATSAGSREPVATSGFPSWACLTGMRIAYVAVTIVVALANGSAAALNFAGAEFVKVVADKVRVSQRWLVPFGILLACGAAGLLAGFAVSVLGTAAARRRPPGGVASDP